ncbi:glycosyltransferase family 2 protein [Catalinimonas niigatensis]|uniref:glycosyltransferase family 2 protein n=1 Tax=Catalinimonas niigatensis TaxID=1397264 RepID=UPI0026661317|nr:glycosyltransferase family 2 protein [Catalinimonas niigatensis]WPP53322.1 glycosyltransferase [Catalinimonas niigatensis]
MKDSSKVSVIIPNYNHAQYLPQRIESVLQQTYQNIEVIILDDFSTDNSKDIINEYAKKDTRIRTHFNEVNSGTTFKQWNRGIQMAKGSYIWIAESDDFADVKFVETVIQPLERDSRIGLSYCMSYIVNKKGEVVGDMLPREFIKLDYTRWQQNYINNGQHECENYMIHKNVIPNASALLFRKDKFLMAGGAPEYLRLSGDWLTYIKMLKYSDIAFNSSCLNYYRVHDKTVRASRSNKHLNVVWEKCNVLSYLADNFNIRSEDLRYEAFSLFKGFFSHKENLRASYQEKEKFKFLMHFIRTYTNPSLLVKDIMLFGVSKITRKF